MHASIFAMTIGVIGALILFFLCKHFNNVVNHWIPHRLCIYLYGLP